MASQVDFAKEFNRRLGQYTGHLAQPTPDSVNNIDMASRLINIRNQYMQKLVADKIEAMNKPGSSGGKPKTTADPKVLGNMSQDAVDLVTEAGGNKSFMGVDMPNVWEIPGPVGRALGPIDEALIGANIQAPLKLGGLALDLISRPAYAEFSAMKNQQDAYSAGEGIGGQLQAAAKGLWTGIKGDTKTGYGDVIESYTQENPENSGFLQNAFNAAVSGLPGMVADKWLEPGNESGWVNTWAKRGLGLAGEVVLDPTNVVGGKAIGSLKYGDEVVDFASDAYRQLAKDAVREGIDDAGLQSAFRSTPRLRGQIKDPVTGAITHAPAPKQGYTAVDEAVDKAIDDVMFQSGGGANKGKLVGHNQSPFAVANNVGIDVRRHLTSDTDNLIRYFVDDINAGNIPTRAQFAQMRAQNPMFGEFLDELLDLSKKSRSAHTYNDIESVLLDYMRNPGKTLLQNVDTAATTVKSRLNGVTLDIQNHVYNKLLGQALNVPGIRVGGKTFKMARLGKGYAGLKAHRLERGGALLKDVKYGDTFVGRTPQVAQRVRSLGLKHYEEFHREVTDMVNGKARVWDVATRKMKTIKVARGLTKAERETIHTNILKGIPAADPRMQEAQDFVVDAYKRLYQMEVDAGVRSGNSIQAQNYVHNFYKRPGVRDKLKEFKEGSTKYLKASAAGGPAQLNPNLMEDAIAAGLRPEKDAFRALLYRKLGSNRKLTKAWFQQDLLDNYGVMGNQITDRLKDQMRLIKQYEHGNLPKDLQDKLGMTRPGDAWYLPRDIDNIYKAFNDLSKKPEHMQGLIRMFDTWTRYFKTAATIPWPGFHIRNSIGDIFMSWIDGVRSKDIAYLKQWDLAARNNPGAIRNIGGRNFTFDQMRNIFRENASSGGHQNVDLLSQGGQASLRPDRVGAAALDLAKHPTGIGNVARRASGAREDLFRFTHFLHAMREELPKAAGEVKNADRALKRAIDASTFRVNKYLFDYGALTGIEQRYLKRAIPFYTYTRKAMPALIESMFLHPSQFSKTNRIFLDDGQDQTYEDMLTPQYQRDIGYARLSDEDEEGNFSLLGGQFLPTDLLKRNSNIGNVKEFAQNIASQTNPFIKGIYERAGGRSYFNDQPIESTGDYLKDAFLPPVRPLEDVPKLGDALSKLPVFDKSSKGSFTEKILSGRVGAGLPYDEVNEGQRTTAAYGVLKEIQKRFDDINGDEEQGTGLQGAGYKLYPSMRGEDATFRIKRLSDDEVVFETKDAQKAMEKAQSLMG